MIKKILCMVLAAVLCVGAVSTVLVGCNNTGDTGNGGKVKLYVADKITDQTGINSWLQQRQDAFDEQFGDRIEVTHLPAPAGSSDEIQAVMLQFTDAVDAPALAQVNSINSNRTLWASGILGDWSDYLTSWDGYANFTDLMKETYTMGDSIIGFPISMEIPLLGFNKQILKDNGYMSEDGVPTDEFLEKVKTWTGFRDVALDLTDATTDPSKPVSGTGMLLADYYLFLGNWMKANGDKLATQAEDGTISLDFANENAVETYEFIHSMRFGQYKSIYHSMNLDLASFMSLIWNNQVASFTFYPTWASWFQSVNYDINNIYVMPFPKNTGHEAEYSAAFYPTSYVLNGKKSKAEQEAAAEYVKFMCSEEAWLDRIDFADSYEIMQIVFPPYKTITIEDMTDMMPADWKSATLTAMEDAKPTELSVDNYVTYLNAKSISILDTESMSRDTIISLLNEAQTTAENEWLNNYNKDILGQ